MSWLDRIFALVVSMHRRAENAGWQKCGRSAKAYQGLRGQGPEMRSRSITRLKREFDREEDVLEEPEMRSRSITRLKHGRVDVGGVLFYVLK